MAELVFNINYEVFKEECEVRKCNTCGDLTLLGFAYFVYVFINNELADEKPILRMCNSCKDATNHIWQ